MNRFRKILIPIDGDPSRQPVLARAAWLAKEYGAAIKLIAVVEDLPWYTRLILPTAAEFQAVLVRDKFKALEERAEEELQLLLAVDQVILGLFDFRLRAVAFLEDLLQPVVPRLLGLHIRLGSLNLGVALGHHRPLRSAGFMEN